jgi:hypothetical protein
MHTSLSQHAHFSLPAHFSYPAHCPLPPTKIIDRCPLNMEDECRLLISRVEQVGREFRALRVAHREATEELAMLREQNRVLLIALAMEVVAVAETQSPPTNLDPVTPDHRTVQEVTQELNALRVEHAVLQKSHEEINDILQKTVDTHQAATQRAREIHASELATLQEDAATLASVRLLIEVTMKRAAAQNEGTAPATIVDGMEKLSILLGMTPVPDSHVDSNSS